MLMEMYAYPPLLLPSLDGTGELCERDETALGCAPCAMMLGVRGMGDLIPGLDVGGIANAFVNYQNARAAADLKKKELALQAQAQKAQQLEDARSAALTQAQAAIAPAEKSRNMTVYSLAAVGGIAALIGTAFLLSAMKGGKRK